MRRFLVSRHPVQAARSAVVAYVSVEVVDYSMNYITRRVGPSSKHSHSTVVFSFLGDTQTPVHAQRADDMLTRLTMTLQ